MVVLGLMEVFVGDHSIPSYLHVRLWFGPFELRRVWLNILDDAGRFRYFAEVWENERWSTVRRKFVPLRQRGERPGWSDERGRLALDKDKITPPRSWLFLGDWFVPPASSTDMWAAEGDDKEGGNAQLFEVSLDLTSGVAC